MIKNKLRLNYLSSLRQRYCHTDFSASAGRALNFKLAFYAADALFHADKPKTALCAVPPRYESTSGIRHFKAQVSLCSLEHNTDILRFRVLGDVV